jgi:hypothetical protein
MGRKREESHQVYRGSTNRTYIHLVFSLLLLVIIYNRERRPLYKLHGKEREREREREYKIRPNLNGLSTDIQ